MVLHTFALAAGLLATAAAADADKPKPEATKGWIVEVRGFVHHKDAAPKARYKDTAPKARFFNVEFLWPQATPPLKIDPVETQYYDDLRGVLEQLKKQKP